MREHRKKIWIDKLQTRMTLRLLGMILAYQTALWVAVVMYVYIGSTVMASSEGSSAAEGIGLAPAALCFLCLVPLFAYSVVKFSHKVVGPLVPLRRAIAQLQAGEPVAPIRLREGDELTELIDEFNAMVAALEARGAVPAARQDAELAGV